MLQRLFELYAEKVRPSPGKSRWHQSPVLLGMAAVYLLAAAPAFCSEAAMNGPRGKVHRHDAPSSGPETSTGRIVFLGAIDLYRNLVSPISSPRCGFFPSCSTFGRQAVGQYGAIRGVMMTGDRLTRCNIFKKPGPDYFLLPDGKLFDPLSGNTLAEQ